ncbi:hypothetical protein HMPREF1544_09876 [Mucor circinelloides 1006PhL]|uniref:GDP/GTP exchange factor Sec2 N-terminal domain-containing protein n=1 Tax=Mucor circinelloides f. circinelloides (strain 1006PhL) TaxID=1220926 RepID=S2JLD2_MUCC1|nr:hypothetical protein HMPREF1544_09876 [Mucor circinelloides 1006PhL]
MNCHHCHSDEIILSLRQELSTKNYQLQRMELDLQTLNQKYVAEIERVGNVQHEKDMVEHELEELSRKLFEEANAMVAIEKRARWQVENELRQTKEHLLAEQTQLHELRLKLTTADDETVASEHVAKKKKSCSNMRAQMDLQELHGLKRASANHALKYTQQKQPHQEQRTISMPPTPSTSNHAIKKEPSTIDGVQLQLFHEYTIASSKQLLSPKKLNQTPFMKHCLSEDIEPCLRFGPQSKLSIKKMIDYLSRQPCFIEHVTSFNMNATPPPPQPVQSKPLWERFNSTANANRNNIIVSNACSACARPADPGNSQSVLLNYRFRLDENENWLPIDQYCRDRLVAVCEFFVFIRNIQMGLYSDRSIEDLYTENIRLRLQMFYSRMGALPVVMDDLGLDPDQIGKATLPNHHQIHNEEEEEEEVEDVYLSDASLSTGPNTPEPHSASPTVWTLDSSTTATTTHNNHGNATAATTTK